MTDTPIIDEACEAYLNGDPVYADHQAAMHDALRAALPWDLPNERLEAMRAAIMSCDEESAWDSIASADCRNAALAAYRADPIMRELYPEKFK